MCVCVCVMRERERGGGERGGGERGGGEGQVLRKGIRRRQMVRDILYKEEGIGIEEET